MGGDLGDMQGCWGLLEMGTLGTTQDIQGHQGMGGPWGHPGMLGSIGYGDLGDTLRHRGTSRDGGHWGHSGTLGSLGNGDLGDMQGHQSPLESRTLGTPGGVRIHWIWGPWGHPQTQRDIEGWGDLRDIQGHWGPWEMGTLGTPPDIQGHQGIGGAFGRGEMGGG